MLNRRADLILWWASFVLCGLLFVAHFSLVQLSNMPMSPLKLQLANVVSYYVDPYFTQQWNFFAPQPIDRDVSLLGRARYHDKATGQMVTVRWVDVTDALIEPLRRSRLTPLFHVEVSLSNAVVGFMNHLGADPRATFEKDGQKYVKPQLAADIDPIDMQTMKRTALATLEIAYPDQSFEEVQLALMIYIFPRFTMRQKAVSDEPLALTLVDWQPAEWVTPYCCYGGKGPPLVRESKVQP
jgi:hypothetical protein